jgi:hypothetical protein
MMFSSSSSSSPGIFSFFGFTLNQWFKKEERKKKRGVESY